MNNIYSKNNHEPIKNFIYNLLCSQVSKESIVWIDNILKEIRAENGEAKIYAAFSMVPCVIGKVKINFNPYLLEEADKLKKGWNPQGWTTDQAARVLFILSLSSGDDEAYYKKIKIFFDVADVGELTALYLGLPLFPYPALHIPFGIEGVRSNMKVVFDSISLNNPFPAENFEINAWNQLVLKAVFLGNPLYKIYGLDDRANAKLANMLSDYAHERWSAKRNVNPELWRPVGPFINDRILNNIKILFQSGEQIQHEAAALACSVSENSQALSLLEERSDLKIKIFTKEITWNTIAEKWYAEKELIIK